MPKQSKKLALMLGVGMWAILLLLDRTGFSVGDSKASVKTNLSQKYKNSSDFIHYILRRPLFTFSQR